MCALRSPPNGPVWHKPFLRWVWAQDCNQDTPGIPQNASGPVGIPLKKAIELSPPRRITACGDDSLRLEERQS